VVEGNLNKEDSKLEMFKFNRIYFAVLCNVDPETAKTLQIMSDDTDASTCSEMTGCTSTN
jgi:hypothetical protein